MSDFRQDQFARRWGFASRQDLLAASSPLVDDGGAASWATKVNGNRWIVWSDESMSADRTYSSLAEATQALKESAQLVNDESSQSDGHASRLFPIAD